MGRETLIILNPASRSGRAARLWPRIASRVRDAIGPAQVEETRAPRDAERLAAEAAAGGVERILVAGGDGTLSEVANGLLQAGLADRAHLGLLPFGTGGDLARGLGVPPRLEAALEVVVRGRVRRIDAGRLEYSDRQGQKDCRYFLNVASFGISGLVDELVNQAPKHLGGTLSFLLGTLQAIVRYRPECVSMRADGELFYRGRIVLVAAANGRTFGGGMQVAPDSMFDDGRLDLVLVEAMNIPQLLRALPRLYAGTHVSHRRVRSASVKCLEADAPAGRVWLDVDGEPLGTLPARFDVVPDAIGVLAP